MMEDDIPPTEPEEPEEDEKNSAIDPELWLQTLLTINQDKERRERMIQKMSEKSGIPPAGVEEVLKVLLNLLIEKTGRAN